LEFCLIYLGTFFLKHMLNRNQDTMTNKSRVISRRMFVLNVAKLVVFGGIVGRLFSLQVAENKKYLTLSDKNRLREWKLPPTRGIIEDYFGNKIAQNEQVFQLHIMPEEVENFNYLFLRLKKIINLTDREVAKLQKKRKKQKPWETLIVSENLSWNEFSKLNLFLHELPGAKPVFSVARKYPNGENSTHVLGYVSEASVNDLENYDFIKDNHVPGLRVGKTGLEKSLEKELIGTAGLQRYEVNAYGKRINQVDFIDGSKGKNFRITLDQKVQDYAQELLKDKSGSICIMDIYTGDIIAMCSSPSFDPNKFVHGINLKDWEEIRENPLKPLINKSVAGQYSPGSTIKPLVALSALEFKVINPKKIIQCEQSMEFYGHTYHCWKKRGHGYMDLRTAIKESCDIYFYEVARRLGVDRLAITAKKYGLGSEVLGDYFTEEKKGLIPTTQWKKNIIGSGWVLGETLITGIGQGYIQSTPIQLCVMTAQIANGGFKIKPRIIYDPTVKFENIKSIIDNKIFSIENDPNLPENENALLDREPNILEPLFRNIENVKFVKDAMFAVSNEPRGTGYRTRWENKKYQYAGKTGTSQVKRFTQKQREEELKNIDRPYKDRDHAVFIAFAPYKNPRYSISVLIEHGGSGSGNAAPLAKKAIKFVIDRHKTREEFINKEGVLL